MTRKKGEKRRPFMRRGTRGSATRAEVAKAATVPIFARAVRVLKERRAVLAFLLRFAIVAGVFLSAYYFPYAPRGLAGTLLRLYLAAYARLAGAALSLFDPAVHVEGTQILGRFNLEFAMNCDAMDVYILFSAAVLACPATWRRHLMGLVMGLLMLVAINVTRIVSLYWVGVHFPSLFEFCHVDLWPILIIAATCTGFLIWARATGLGDGLAPNAHEP
jgi:exosortase/archaeosortase family protein